MAKKIISIETVEQIRDFFEQKKTATEISKILKIDVNKITDICKENNIVNPKYLKSTIIDEDVIKLVLEMVGQNFTMQTISEKIDYSKKAVRKLYRKLGLKIKGGQKPLSMPTDKLCKYNNGNGCNLVKPVSEFRMVTKTRLSGNTYTRPHTYCYECELKIQKINSKKHYANNTSAYQARSKKNRPRNNALIKLRKQNDPVFKLRIRVSGAIGKHLKRNKGSKNSNSIMNFLPYTIKELKNHLESQFEPWMTWKNHGNYKLGGERKWHIDHIIPQSLLPFDTMEHPNFLKCWELKNLQPLEAVENIKKSDNIINITDQIMHNQTLFYNKDFT